MIDSLAIDMARRASPAALLPPPTPRIMAKYKAVFDKRVSLPCHVIWSGNMYDALTSAANGRKIDKFHKGHEVA